MSGHLVEPRITVTLDHDGRGRVGSAQIASTRAAHLSRLFEGQRPAEVMRLLPVIFTLCGHAHRMAARRALEQALGETCPAERQRIRSLLVQVENLREHLLRILMQWPSREERSRIAPLLPRIQATTSRMLEGLAEMEAEGETGGMHHLKPLLDEVTWPIEREVLGIPLSRFRAWNHGTLERWIGEGGTVAARFLHRSLADGALAEGAGDPPPLDEAVLITVRERLLGEGWPDFVLRPEGPDGCRSTGPLSRQREHPLLRGCPSGGNWPVVRHFVARLLEVAETAESCHRLMEGENLPAPATPPAAIAAVETSRGVLVHLAEVAKGRVVAYRILAPTEWNFHPAGAAARLLTRIRASDTRAMERMAHRAMLAVDPCVGFDLRLRAAA